MRDVDFSYRMFMKVVVFRFRLLAFRGACGEPPLRFAPLGVSPAPRSRRTRKATTALHRTKKM
ncbi:hypothetical protein ABE41_015900 [Fictibacillus arsenicus]|uniref:Uncharacterized protein n=1 Tax=Fictibacillus arsenicus TaxID=255247 RepID=A0A1B1Z7V2_9BACL|nr:hypothetical protein ABE41_015900 [Fictibacillus arsenicus]